MRSAPEFAEDSTLSDDLISAARRCTHPISAALFADLATGQSFAPLHRLAAAFETGSRRRNRAGSKRRRPDRSLVGLRHAGGVRDRHRRARCVRNTTGNDMTTSLLADEPLTVINVGVETFVKACGKRADRWWTSIGDRSATAIRDSRGRSRSLFPMRKIRMPSARASTVRMRKRSSASVRAADAGRRRAACA